MKGAVSRYTANRIKQDVVLFSYRVVSDSLRPPWTEAYQASLSFTISQNLCKLMAIESVIQSNHLVLCHSLLLLPSVFPSIRVFSSESALCIRWPKYWSFSFSISPSSGYSRLLFFSIDWFDLLTIQGTLKSLLQYCTFIYIRKREKLWKDKSETDNGCLSGKRWREDSLDTLCYRVCIRKTSQSFSCVLPLLTHNAAPLTLLTLNVFFPPHQALLWPQLSVPQLDSFLTLPTWRRHQTPQAKNSDPQDCTPHPTHRCQWQGVDPPSDPQLLSNLAANQRFPLLGTREFVRVAHGPQGNTFASLSHNKGKDKG